MINILELCLSQGVGGLELYVHKTAVMLDSNQFRIYPLLCKNSFLHKKFEQDQIPSVSVRWCTKFLPFILAYRIARYIDKNRIDIIHMHWGHDLLLSVLAKTWSKRKPGLVYTRQMNLTRKKSDPYHRFLYRHVDAYVPITQQIVNDAKRYLPLDYDRIHLNYLGVPGQDEKPDCSWLDSSDIRRDAFKVAIFGRIEAGKGQHLVVDAVRQLKDAGHDIQCAVVGHIMDQTYFSQIESDIKRMNLQAVIKYLGFHDRPVSIMGCFDVVILATRCETFGLVLPEAMRAGVVVVGSNCGGVPEIITHNKTGLLFTSGDVDSLGECLRRLIEEPGLRERLALAGKQEADQRFTEERHFLSLAEIFKNLCGN